MDSCVGIVADAVENDPNQENTIVILWNDHGSHLDEKQHWAKQRLWEASLFVEDDRVIARYHGAGEGNMVAVSSDPLLLNGKKVTGGAVIPLNPDGLKPPYRVFDPCIWKRDGIHYSLSAGSLPEGPGGKPVRANSLYRSKDLASWECLHPFLENDRFGLVGDDGACTYFWPIGDKHILLHFSHMSGGKYLLGEYDTGRDKLVVTDGGDFNFGAYSVGVSLSAQRKDADLNYLDAWRMRSIWE